MIIMIKITIIHNLIILIMITLSIMINQCGVPLKILQKVICNKNPMMMPINGKVTTSLKRLCNLSNDFL